MNKIICNFLYALDLENSKAKIQTDNIGDAWGFSIEILTGITPSWKTELNRSISTMEDRIPRWLQHHHEMCCEKGGLV